MMYDEDDPFLRPPPKQEKSWDQFPDSPREVVSDSMVESKLYNVSLKVLHLLAFLVTFIVVLGAGVISKGTLLFMTSQVSNTDTKPYCNKDIDPNRQFVVTLPVTERVAWIWLLFYAYCIPQVGIFIRSVRICIFKKFNMPSKLDFAFVMATESLPPIGSALLVYCILPEMDVIKGAMLTNGVCFIPSLLSVLMGKKCGATSTFRFAFDVVATSCQATVFIAWPFVEGKPVLWTIPLAVLCIAAGYWENFIKYDVKEEDFLAPQYKDTLWKSLARSRINFTNDRYFIYSFVSIWKMLVFFTTMVLIFLIRDGDASFIFDFYGQSMRSHTIYITEIAPVISSNLPEAKELIATGLGAEKLSDSWTPIYVFLINIVSTYLCYIFGKFACKILIQGFSYAFPINMTMPVALSILIGMSGTYARDECAYAGTIPLYLFFDIPPLYFLEEFLVQEYAWIWLLWVLSQAWITRHIWTPSSERLARTERLFMRPMYDPFLIDQDVAMNRRRETSQKHIFRDDNSTSEEDSKRSYAEDIDGGPDKTTRIYACGTMWHETKDEMMAFLKSILHLDADQCARKIASIEFNIEDDYYELETHIFFDDAFVRFDDDPEPHLNDYVNLLIVAMDEARRDVHEVDVAWPGPVKLSTPYGGRLIWKLPGGSRIVAHLKDKKKIRAKKRWSQVMYMYYLLGHRLMSGPFLEAEKQMRAERTFLLALDGDIDFQPHAVLLLVDLMKKSKAVGAACGRIHPIGSGPMVWYQIFEYAIGHWLQKATEHVIGCVLCSPGCFSLFRGSALMEDNVMKKYTTEASAARHFVQYDQGEDRWLCTLLLQRGFRVEYSAASDAYTHCPEGFNEFYNQRRRWMPSTTANIMDLLTDYKYICHTNDNISKLYILYQGVMMLGTVLGPGTIFLMLVGAFVAAFQMDQWTSFLWNAIPILTFMAVCKLFEKADVQLFFAGLLSAIYGLVMMAVLVGVMMQIQQDGPLAPSSLFFFFIAGEFIVTALMHPKEFNCLMYGVIYYVTVPSMYLLLVIYSIFNMNNISWGTRETVITTKPGAEAAAPTVAPKKQKAMWSFLDDSKEDRGIISNILTFLCGTQLSREEERLVAVQQSLEAIQTRLGMIEKQEKDLPEEEPQPFSHLGNSQEENASVSSMAEDYEELNYWMDEGERIKKCATDILTEEETTFWQDLVEKYLKPDALANDSKEKQQIKKDLSDLRDKSVAAFFMINALFVLVVFLLTLKKDILHINWPFGVKTNFTYFGDTHEISMTKEYLELEPIGFVFLIFFGILMIVQFLAMFQHRFETMCQILANMEFNFSFFKRSASEMSEDRPLKGQYWIEAIKEMQKLKPDDETEEKYLNGQKGGARNTVMFNRRKQERLKNVKTTLLESFQEAYRKACDDDSHGGPKTKQQTKQFKKTVNVQAMARRKTQMQARKTQTMGGGRPQSGGYNNDGFSLEGFAD